MHILITGGAGFIGSALSKRLLKEGHKVTSLDLKASTSKGVTSVVQNLLEPLDPIALEGVDGIIHLAGASINKPWTESYKELIYQSRIASTQQLAKAIAACKQKPSFFFSASAIGIYGDRGDVWLDESSEPGKGFLASVVNDWEQEVGKISDLGCRVAIFRHGHVLGNGGLVGTLLPYYKKHLGGPIGSGNYYLSWIHIEDLVTIYLKAITDSSMQGTFNAVADTVLYKDFSKELSKATGKLNLFFIPKLALSILYSREFVNEITSSQRVKTEFNEIKNAIQYTDIRMALKEIV